MADEFVRFADNLFKTPRERRQREAAAKSQQLEDLWLNVVVAERTDRILDLYERCVSFLNQYSDPEINNSASTSQTNNNTETEVNTDAKINTETFQTSSNSVAKMANFELKSASSIVPDFDASTDNIRDFVDCATYYNNTLTADGKKVFLNYLLKVKLKGKAKTAIIKDPESFEELETLLKSRFKPKTTVAALQQQLSVLQQNNRSVSDFAADIEGLTNRLTELQVSDLGSASRETVQNINESMALSALKRGASSKIKSVLLASQALDFASGVTLALEAEAGLGSVTPSVNYIHRSSDGRRGAYQHSRGWRGNRNNGSWRPRSYRQSYQGRPGRGGGHDAQPNYSRGHNGQYYSNRGRNSSARYNHRGSYTNHRGAYQGNGKRGGATNHSAGIATIQVENSPPPTQVLSGFSTSP